MIVWIIFVIAIVLVIGILLSHHMMKQKLFVLQDFDTRMIKKAIQRVVSSRSIDRSDLLYNLVEVSKAEQTLLDLIDRRNSNLAEDFSGHNINESLEIVTRKKEEIIGALLSHYPELKPKHELADKIGWKDEEDDEEDD